MEALGLACLPGHVWLSMNHMMHHGLTIQNTWRYPTRLRPSVGVGPHGTRGSLGPCHNGEGKPGSHVIRGDPEPSPCWLVRSGPVWAPLLMLTCLRVEITLVLRSTRDNMHVKGGAMLPLVQPRELTNGHRHQWHIHAS
jgi:hypothetical protein